MWQAFSLVSGQIVFQALLATDYGRFSKVEIGYKGTFGIMFGEMIMIAVVLVFGALLAYTIYPAITQGILVLYSTDPGFVFALVMGFLGVVFTIVTQIRINVMNLYSGSLAFSNTWDAFSEKKIRRNWWMVGLLVLGIALYPINVLQYTDKFLAVTGIMTNTWIFILLADYFICRKVLEVRADGEDRVRRAQDQKLESLRNDRHGSRDRRRGVWSSGPLPRVLRLVPRDAHRSGRARGPDCRDEGPLLRTCCEVG